MGCENPVQPNDSDLDKPLRGTEAADCIKYRLWPHTVEIVGEFEMCGDGLPPEVVAAQWESAESGTCPVTQDGSKIKGGLQAVRYLYGCQHGRQAPPRPTECADCGEGKW